MCTALPQGEISRCKTNTREWGVGGVCGVKGVGCTRGSGATGKATPGDRPRETDADAQQQYNYGRIQQ